MVSLNIQVIGNGEIGVVRLTASALSIFAVKVTAMISAMVLFAAVTKSALYPCQSHRLFAFLTTVKSSKLTYIAIWQLSNFTASA
jgi:hypothetical protein